MCRKWTVHFDRTGPTTKSGPSRKVELFSQNFSVLACSCSRLSVSEDDRRSERATNEISGEQNDLSFFPTVPDPASRPAAFSIQTDREPVTGYSMYSVWTEPIHSLFDQNFPKFLVESWLNGSRFNNEERQRRGRLGTRFVTWKYARNVAKIHRLRGLRSY